MPLIEDMRRYGTPLAARRRARSTPSSPAGAALVAGVPSDVRERRHVCKASCRRRSACRVGGSVEACVTSCSTRRCGGWPPRRRPASATLVAERRPDSLRRRRAGGARRGLLPQLRAADRALRARARGRAALAARLRAGARSGRRWPASPRPTWSSAARPSPAEPGERAARMLTSSSPRSGTAAPSSRSTASGSTAPSRCSTPRPATSTRPRSLVVPIVGLQMSARAAAAAARRAARPRRHASRRRSRRCAARAWAAPPGSRSSWRSPSRARAPTAPPPRCASCAS